MDTLKPGDVVIADFPGVTGVKRRPAVVSSTVDYHTTLIEWDSINSTLITPLALGSTSCTKESKDASYMCSMPDAFALSDGL